MARRHRRVVRESPSRGVDLERLAIVFLADADDSEDEEIGISLALIALNEKKRARSARFGRRGHYDQEKVEAFFNNLMHSASERVFKAWFRMERSTFWHLHDLIHDDPIFLSTSNRPQRPVKYQLATFLCRVGAESALKTAGIMAIAEGTVFLYSHRVCKAFRHIRGRFLAWPGNERRAFLSDAMSAWGFPSCIGIGDGSYIRLQEKPRVNGFSYFCRKKFYALIIQGICDHRAIFTAYEFGWPGSVQDSRVFKNSDMWLKREQYFWPHEYILVDKGYPLTKFSIRPFHDHDLTNDPVEARRRKAWNRKLSSLRIFIEHAFGRLKGRFPILRNMPGHNLEEMYKTIEALMVIHNVLESRRDDPTTIEGFNGEEDDDVDDVRGVIDEPRLDINLNADEK